jgi:hypothetical protein
VREALAKRELQLVRVQRPIEEERHHLGDRDRPRAGRERRLQALDVVGDQLVDTDVQAAERPAV